MQYRSARPLFGAAGSTAVEGAGVHVAIGNNAAAEAHRVGCNGLLALTAPDQAMAPFVPADTGPPLEPYFDTLPRPDGNAVCLEPRTYSDTAQGYARAR